MQLHLLFRASVFCSLLLACQASAAGNGSATNEASAKNGLSTEWHKWFGAGHSVQRLEKAPFPVFAVTATNGQVSGWVFRADQVPPVVKGMHGPIGLMVGMGKDGLIKGVHMVENHEDLAYFGRIKPAFYTQFNGKPASRQGVKVDTVTGSTVSSRAIVEDVFLSSQTVMALPEVNPLLQLAPQAGK